MEKEFSQIHKQLHLQLSYNEFKSIKTYKEINYLSRILELAVKYSFLHILEFLISKGLDPSKEINYSNLITLLINSKNINLLENTLQLVSKDKIFTQEEYLNKFVNCMRKKNLKSLQKDKKILKIILKQDRYLKTIFSMRHFHWIILDYYILGKMAIKRISDTSEVLIKVLRKSYQPPIKYDRIPHYKILIENSTKLGKKSYKNRVILEILHSTKEIMSEEEDRVSKVKLHKYYSFLFTLIRTKKH